jgi:hypothetical protein
MNAAQGSMMKIISDEGTGSRPSGLPGMTVASKEPEVVVVLVGEGDTLL